MNTQSHLSIVVMAAAACMAVGACATAAPPGGADNAEHLSTAESSQVAGICENVLGLKPSERPSSGTWLAGAHLAPVTSHYQGCISSLSDSLQQTATASNAQRADADCRALGLASGSPALALCVLRSEQPSAATPQNPASAASAAAAAATPSASSIAAEGTQAGLIRTGSFFYASANETVRREQLACAALGLEPPYGQFASCVKSLQETFFAIDNPIE